MNREIKFRAWDLEKKEWIKGTGTTFSGSIPEEGSVALSLGGHLRVFRPSCYEPDEDENGRITKEAVKNQLHGVANSEYESVSPLDTKPHYKRQYVLMQYIGLHDKNGKEIYEGDIVECEQKGQTKRGVVNFREGMFNWEFEKDALSWLAKAVKKWKGRVIGNIYENPNLLKEEQT
ncbi:YopX family protein [Candidatus Woesearchaeota archaeon]|nr:YopX family protein [Candidatus Woesearchaeota archaeon]